MKTLHNHFIPVVSYLSLLLTLLLPVPALAEGIKFKLLSHIGFTSIEELVITILNTLLVIAIPIIIFFIIYGGFQYVTANGNVQQVQTGTRTITYAIIGGVLVIGAVAISEVIANVVSSFLAS